MADNTSEYAAESIGDEEASLEAPRPVEDKTVEISPQAQLWQRLLKTIPFRNGEGEKDESGSDASDTGSNSTDTSSSSSESITEAGQIEHSTCAQPQPLEVLGRGNQRGAKSKRKPGALYTQQPIPGKGYGLVAATKIERGTKIMGEKPLLKVYDYQSFGAEGREDIDLANFTLTDELQCLPTCKHQKFMSLSNAHPVTPAIPPNMGILCTNAFLVNHDGTGAVFAKISRINHSCRPNANDSWDASSQQMMIYAIKDIEGGEEITISYYTILARYNMRQRYLRENFLFDCTCELCALPESERDASDKRIREIARRKQSIEQMLNRMTRYNDGKTNITTSARLNLKSAKLLLQMLQEEGMMGTEIAQAYHYAFRFATANKDFARAKGFAAKAKAESVLIEGRDDLEEDRQEMMLAQPNSSAFYQEICPAKTSEVLDGGEIPAGLDEDQLERWLWGDDLVGDGDLRGGPKAIQGEGEDIAQAREEFVGDMQTEDELVNEVVSALANL